jgi:GDP-4-dehydro-6-deoxy-D-mannose reductase
MSPTAFITGIGGFVGRYLSKQLKSAGFRIIGMLGPGEEVHPWVQESADSLLEADLLNSEKLQKTIEEVSADVIVHLAALSAPGKSFDNPLLYYSVNVNGTLNLLEAVRVTGRATRVVIYSSSDVYGYVQPDELPLTEKSRLKPANPYAASKVACHLIARQYEEHFHQEIVEIRPFNMIGPEQAKGFVVPDFASQVAEIVLGKSEPTIKVGRITDQRDFLDIRDAVRAMQDIIVHGRSGETYNICSGKARPVSDILELLKQSSEKDFTVEQDQSRIRPAKMPLLYGSHQKVSSLAGWKPEIPFNKTIEDCLQFWKENC